MEKMVFDNLLKIISIKISEIENSFILHNISFQRKAKELKAGSYGGHDKVRCLKEFGKFVDQQLSILFQETSRVFVSSGRKLSEQQYGYLKEYYTGVFDSYIQNFRNLFSIEFQVEESLRIMFDSLKFHTTQKIENYISAMEYLRENRIDKALIWTAVGTVFAGISLILSVIAIFY